MDSLPEALVRSQPRLGMAAAWSFLWAAQPLEAKSLLDDVERHLAGGQGEDSADLERRQLGELAAIKANLAYMQYGIEDTGHLAQIALEKLPGDELFLRSIAYLMLGHARRQEGQPLAADPPYSQAIAAGRSEGIISTGLLAAGFLVQVKTLQGRLHQAQSAFREAVTLADEMGVTSLPSLGVAYGAYGDVLREWNDLDSAESHLRRGIDLCKPWQGLLLTSLENYVGLARVRQAAGDIQGGLALIESALDLAFQYELPQNISLLEAWQAQLWLAQDRFPAAAEWARQRDNRSVSKPALVHEREELVLARLLILQERGKDAIARLLMPLRQAQEAERMASVVEILAVQALAWQTAGDLDAALASLAEALTLAEAEGFIRAFVDEGEGMERLLRRAAVRGIALDYTSYLLDAFQSKADPFSPAIPGVEPLSEPLTEREVEVLRLIAAGLTNRQIAEELVVALGTVKAHINSIYRKLDVSNRVQAVSRARELKLLVPDGR